MQFWENTVQPGEVINNDVLITNYYELGLLACNIWLFK